MKVSAEPLEAYVRERVVQILDLDGEALGTGFRVAGGILTCAHVVSTKGHLQLAVPGGEVTEVLLGETCDAAFLKAAEVGSPLPTCRRRPEEVMVVGHPLAPGMHGAMCAITQIRGTAAIRFTAAGRRFDVLEAWMLSGMMISPGHSGSPVVDVRSGAVVGMVVANFVRPDGLDGPSGFVLPFATIADDPKLADILFAAETDVPRLGPEPNAAGAIEWTRAACEAELARLADERLFDPSGTVQRKDFEQELERFLKAEAHVWAIVDRSGLGKTTVLANLAYETNRSPVLLLRAMEIDPSVADINALAGAKLAAVAPNAWLDVPTLDDLAAGSADVPLVLLDGINEAQIDNRALRDVWLPRAIEQAASCKLVLSCRPETWDVVRARLPKRVLHGAEAGEAEANVVQHGLGEFTDAERREFVLTRKFVDHGWVEELRNPLLLNLAAELRSDLEGERPTRWMILRRWIERDCAAAAADRGLDARLVEALLERVALECQKTGRRTIDRTSPLAQGTEMECLLRQHLLLPEGRGFGFRYDALFEHLVARSVEVGDLKLVDGWWSQNGKEVDWSIVACVCDRLTTEEDSVGVSKMWTLLSHAGVRNIPSPAWGQLIACMSALPVPSEQEEIAMEIFESAATDRIATLHLERADLLNPQWSYDFSRRVLHLAVRASSGYDFRDNDLSNDIRHAGSLRHFEIQGFPRHVASLLASDREGMLAALSRWHGDETKLGTIWGDNTKESTVSSWTNCCFVYLSELFSDEELLSVPDKDRSAPIFHGLALCDPDRLLRISRTLATHQTLRQEMFRSALRALRGHASSMEGADGNQLLKTAVELGLTRVEELADAGFANEIVSWASGVPERSNDAWEHLLRLIDERVAEAGTLRAFLEDRPEAVCKLAIDKPEAFRSMSGSVLLELAKAPFFRRGPPSDRMAELRLGMLRSVAEEEGFSSRVCTALENLLYDFTAEQSRSSGLMQMVFDAVASERNTNAILYFAGDQNAALEPSTADLADEVANAIVRTAPDEDAVNHLFKLRVFRERAAARGQGCARPAVLASIIAEMVTRSGVEPVIQKLKKSRNWFDSHPNSWRALIDLARNAVDTREFNDASECLLLSNDV